MKTKHGWAVKKKGHASKTITVNVSENLCNFLFNILKINPKSLYTKKSQSFVLLSHRISQISLREGSLGVLRKWRALKLAKNENTTYPPTQKRLATPFITAFNNV